MYVISYDIDIDKVRNKIAKTLLDYGHRVQYSVFECDIKPKKLDELYAKLSELVTEDVNGSIRIYELCGRCSEKITTIGLPEEVPLDDIFVI